MLHNLTYDYFISHKNTKLPCCVHFFPSSKSLISPQNLRIYFLASGISLFSLSPSFQKDCNTVSPSTLFKAASYEFSASLVLLQLANFSTKFFWFSSFSFFFLFDFIILLSAFDNFCINWKKVSPVLRR